MAKYVVFYTSADNVLETAPIHFAAHSEHGRGFHERGELLMYGPFADPRDGAMAILRTRDAAEAFARDDPFVVNGVVVKWEIREWNEGLTP